MNKKNYQKIFKRSVSDRLYADLRSSVSLQDYFKDFFKVDKKETLASTIEIQGRLPNLKVHKKDIASGDLDNAIKFYEYYKNIDETQASDSRFWVYLTHVDFRKYCLTRWGISGHYKDFKKEEEIKKAITFITEHWFVSGNDRDLRRNALARLWWAAHLTYAPWERDPEFFSDLKIKDAYYFTRVLLFTQDIYQQVLERAMGRSNRILISILEFLGENKKFAQSREKIRNLVKELNLVYGTKEIIMLDRKTLKDTVLSIAEEIEKQHAEV
ncbi:MAG: DUF6339 family protein [Candidatus Staskawiczbacteria bacterium]|jgi:hypothetical protein